MIYNLLDFRLLVSDANPTLGGDGVFALWALRACSYKPKGETAHQGLSTERHSIRRKQHLRFLRYLREIKIGSDYLQDLLPDRA